MSSEPPFPIFNVNRARHENHSFPQFARLPKELRLMIWRYALRRHRIVRLYLYDSTLENLDREAYTEHLRAYLSDPPQSLRGNGSYSVTMLDVQFISKFFRVCRDSREAALSHYRVRIPCRYPQSPDNNETASKQSVGQYPDPPAVTPGTFYFCPEWDFLHFECFLCVSSLIPPFLHDLRTRFDPQHKGLMNLILSRDPGSSNGKGGFLDMEPSNVHPEFCASVKSTLQELREVFFEDFQVIGRMSLGLVTLVSNDWFFNRSFPIQSDIPTFDRLSSDPRPSDTELGRLYLSWQLVSEPQKFHDLLSRFGIPPATSTSTLKFKVAHRASVVRSGNHRRICSAADAQEWLEKDCDRMWNKKTWFREETVKVFDIESYVMDVEPAFGFWLFPAEVAAVVNKDKVSDLRAFRPEIGLGVM